MKPTFNSDSLISLQEESINISKEDKERLLALLNVVFNEFHSTNEISLFFGFFTSSADSALTWILNTNACDILSTWLNFNTQEKIILLNFVRISTVIAMIAIDMYSAKGMIEQVRQIFARRVIFPSYFKKITVTLFVSFFISAFSAISPAGLAYKEFFNDKAKAIYFAIAIAIVAFLSGGFFMVNVIEEIKKSFQGVDLSREKDKEKTIIFLNTILQCLCSASSNDYDSKMENIYTLLENNDIDNIISLLNLNVVPRISNINNSLLVMSKNVSTDNLSFSVVNSSKKTMLLSLFLGLFPTLHLGSLYFYIGYSYIPLLLPNSDDDSLSYFRYASAASFSLTYACIGLYFGFEFFHGILNINKKTCNLKNVFLALLSGLIGSIAAITSVSLTHDSMNSVGGYMYCATYFSMFIIYTTAIYQISLKEYAADLYYDIQKYLFNLKKYFYPQKYSLISQPMNFFPPQAELPRKLNSLILQIECVTNEDLRELAETINAVNKFS